MLLLNLALCCFRMCIPSNETQKCSQNDLYVLETMGGWAGWRHVSKPIRPPRCGESWGTRVFYQEASKGWRAKEEPLRWWREKRPVGVQGHLGNTSGRQTSAVTSALSFDQHLLGARCVVDHRQLRTMKDTHR